MGADGTNHGAVCDVGYCHYTYADLGNGDFGMYEEIDGWDKKKGMPVMKNHKLSSTMNNKATSPVKQDQLKWFLSSLFNTPDAHND